MCHKIVLPQSGENHTDGSYEADGKDDNSTKIRENKEVVSEYKHKRNIKLSFKYK
jgi:hypothetical protein